MDVEHEAVRGAREGAADARGARGLERPEGLALRRIVEDQESKELGDDVERARRRLAVGDSEEPAEGLFAELLFVARRRFRCGRTGIHGFSLQHFALHAVQAASLLQHVRQLVSDEPAAFAGAGLELRVAEEHVATNGERAGAGALGEAHGFRVTVHADIAELSAEAAFHEVAQIARQRLAAA